jgi:hexokinase
MALDLGGTNFRVLELALKGGGRLDGLKSMKFAVPKRATAGSAKTLFSFLASSVKKFLASKGGRPSKAADMGFTFSFPTRQRGIASGELVVWTKGFSAGGVVGRDVVRLLKDALVREGLYGINISALANDTVGTLAAGAYGDRSCDAGVIIGTGTNACYVEKAGRIKKLPGAEARLANMIVNIEWGNFNKLRKTVYDRRLDALTINPGSQTLEKMVSGMYLGELVRLVLIDCAIRGALSCPDGIRRAFGKPMSFKSEYMSEIESDSSPDMRGTLTLLKRLGVNGSSPEDRKFMRTVCGIISGRAAIISAAAMIAVMTRIEPSLSRKHTIAIDGSVYEKHPGFAANIRKAMREILGARAAKIRLVLTKDGSGIGAAIIAAVAASGRRLYEE